MKQKKTPQTSEIHRYRLYRGLTRDATGNPGIEVIVLSIGEHGEMLSTPSSLGTDESEPSMRLLIEHNTAELTRARDQAAKWEERLRQDPLGKTLQDLVLYYREAVRVFEEQRDPRAKARGNSGLKPRQEG